MDLYSVSWPPHNDFGAPEHPDISCIGEDVIETPTHQHRVRLCTFSPQLSSSVPAVPLEPMPPLRSVLSVSAVGTLWVKTSSARPVLESSTMATPEPLGRVQLFSA